MSSDDVAGVGPAAATAPLDQWSEVRERDELCAVLVIAARGHTHTSLTIVVEQPTNPWCLSL